MQFIHRLQRIARNRLRRNRRIDDLIDERAIGAIFEQSAHQVSQQILVLADRRIDATTRLLLAVDLIVQRFTHAVQALKFEVLLTACELQNRGHRMRVMGGKLWIDSIGHGHQFACVCDVGHIGADLAREHRVVVQPQYLRALDLGIPVGALDQAHHDPAVEFLRERVEPVEHRGGTTAEGLHHDAETVPAAQRRIGQHGLDDVQRNVEPVGLFRIDVESHVGRAGQHRKRLDTGHEFIDYALILPELVSCMQRR